MCLCAFALPYDCKWRLDNGGVGWGVHTSPAAVYNLTVGPHYPRFSICSNQAQVLYYVLTGEKKMHIEVDSSSSNPCRSRVNSIFRVESCRDANVKRKSRISPTGWGFHTAIREICMQPYLVRRHTSSLSTCPWRDAGLCAWLMRHYTWVAGCRPPHAFPAMQ